MSHSILNFFARKAIAYVFDEVLREKKQPARRAVQRTKKPVAASPVVSNHGDIKLALKSLGYGEREATLAVQDLPVDVGVEAGIKMALKAKVRT